MEIEIFNFTLKCHKAESIKHIERNLYAVLGRFVCVLQKHVYIVHMHAQSSEKIKKI